MDDSSTIDITDFMDKTVVKSTWEDFVSVNSYDPLREDSGGMELEELNGIESTLDKNEPYHYGGGASTHYVITKGDE